MALRYISATQDIYRAIDCCSINQRGISYSSFGAEIMAASTADNCGYYYIIAFNGILASGDSMHELLHDSRSLFDTVTTMQECREYRLHQTVQVTRSSFDCGDLFMIRCILRINIIMDSLNKITA